MKKILLLTLFTFLGLNNSLVNAQAVCGGTFTDSGGTTSNYNNNTDVTTTICPTTPGDLVSVIFTSFDIESTNDALYVYNGNSIAAPQIVSSNSAGNVPGGLAGGFWGTTLPAPITSSSPDGCLTFRFRSNETITNSGWNAEVICSPIGTCLKPTQLVASSITETSFVVNWTENNAATAWEIYVAPQGTPYPTYTTSGIVASSNSFVITGLTPNSCYDVYVRSICNYGLNEISTWSNPISVCNFDCASFGTCGDYINAIAFIDSNGNGIKDGSEINFNAGTFNYSLNDGAAINSYSNNGDLYIPATNPLTTFDLSYVIPSYLNSYYTCATSYNNISVSAGSGANYYYFPVSEITPFVDLETTIYANPPRPGFSRNCQLYYKNNSTITIPSGTITFTKDNLETINSISISQPGTIATANGFTYNFTNLAPQENRFISFILQTPTIPTVNLGDLLMISSSVTPISGDVFPENNNSTLTQTVVGSYDPNEIYESRGPQIGINNFSINDYLTYTITFENTGTANAEFVRIENLLNSQLNPNSIEIINSSHIYDLKLENNKLTWFFYDINLPPTSLNPINSHGFVSYRIKPNPGFAVGTIIPNTANIFFDFNPAIVTNTFNTEFVAALGNATFESGNFMLVPNPATNSVQIQLKNSSERINTISIYDVLGNRVKSIESVNSEQIQIQTSELSSGIYIIEVINNTNLKEFKKLVIK